MVKTFYVCSYGGCGSTMLCDSLNKYGKTVHIHSPKPPDNLEYILLLLYSISHYKTLHFSMLLF